MFDWLIYFVHVLLSFFLPNKFPDAWPSPSRRNFSLSYCRGREIQPKVYTVHGLNLCLIVC